MHNGYNDIHDPGKGFTDHAEGCEEKRQNDAQTDTAENQIEGKFNVLKQFTGRQIFP
jgi:hypothetical protein